MNPEVIYMVGAAGAGKTTYAKHLCDLYGYHYVSFDSLWTYGHPHSEYPRLYRSLSESLSQELKKHDTVVLDGMMFRIAHLMDYDFDTQHTIVYADFDTIQDRGKTHSSVANATQSKEAMYDVYLDIYEHLVLFDTKIVNSHDGMFVDTVPSEFFTHMGGDYLDQMNSRLPQKHKLLET
jgi:adenylate kinase family enzyme